MRLPKIPLPLAIILVATACVYAPSMWNGYVNLDDPLLVSENPRVLSFSMENVRYVFTHFDPELYIPVTFLSYQIPIALFGPEPWHLHLLSILLHVGCVCLVWSIARRVSSSITVAAITAGLLALHPVNAEAVLWISARKDILSSFFALLSFHFFLLWDEEGKKKFFALSIGAFVLALLSKISVILFPMALLMLSRTKKRPITHLLPFFGASVAAGIVAVIGKSVVESSLSPLPALFMAFRSTAFYLRILAWPSGLAASHAVTPSAALQTMPVLLSIFVVTVVSIAAWTSRRSIRGVAWGWIFFLLLITPTFAHYVRGQTSFMLGSERYVYLASAGMFFAVGSLVAATMERCREKKHLKMLAATVFVACGATLAWGTTSRVPVFANAITFNEDIIAKNPDDARAHHNLGLAFESEGKNEEAEREYRRSIELEPTLLQALTDLGALLVRTNRRDDGEELFRQAIDIRPDSFKGYFLLASSKEERGEFDAALDLYREAEKRFTDFPAVHLRIATVLGKMKRFDEALEEFRVLAILDPTFRENAEAALYSAQQ